MTDNKFLNSQYLTQAAPPNRNRIFTNVTHLLTCTDGVLYSVWRVEAWVLIYVKIHPTKRVVNEWKIK